MSKNEKDERDPYRIARTDIPEENELIRMTDAVSAELGVSPPKRIIIEENPKIDAGNAKLILRWGRTKHVSPSTGDLVLTTGLLEKLTPLEVKAVIGHELTPSILRSIASIGQ